MSKIFRKQVFYSKSYYVENKNFSIRCRDRSKEGSGLLGSVEPPLTKNFILMESFK